MTNVAIGGFLPTVARRFCFRFTRDCFSTLFVISFMSPMYQNLIHIQSLELPLLAPYRTMRQPMDHLRTGIFVAEGSKVVLRLLRSTLTMESLLLTPEWFDRLFADGPPRIGLDIPAYVAPKELLEQIVGFHLHQGIMAVAKIPAAPPLDAWVTARGRRSLVVALDGLVNSENVGVIVRNASGFGAAAIITGETSSSPYLRRAVRNSMGTVFNLTVFQPDSLVETLRMLHVKHAYEIVAADPNVQESLYEARFSERVCLVLGNEGEGLSPAVHETCTRRIAIPMANGTDSLNVANASAVFLYELSRKNPPV